MVASWRTAVTTAFLLLHSPLVTKAFNVFVELQRCVTVHEILDNVCPHFADRRGSHHSSSQQKQKQAQPAAAAAARMVLVRLNKQLITMQNKHSVPLLKYQKPILDTLHCLLLQQPSRDADVDCLVDGIKASASIARTLYPVDPKTSCAIAKTIVTKNTELWTASPLLFQSPQHIAGLLWAMDCLVGCVENNSLTLPTDLEAVLQDHSFPFRIHPGLLVDLPPLQDFQQQVQFGRDEIQTTTTQQIVRERRQTAWQGDTAVGPFVYSGKSMPRQDWSPLVLQVRDQLYATMGIYYDCCLINLYPGGGSSSGSRSGMRYHSDPDQGTLWSFDTMVVSIGATRRFAFRSQSMVHNVYVSHGDVTHMYGDCQARFEHTVKKPEDKTDTSARISLVFKQRWQSGGAASTKKRNLTADKQK